MTKEYKAIIGDITTYSKELHKLIPDTMAGFAKFQMQIAKANYLHHYLPAIKRPLVRHTVHNRSLTDQHTRFRVQGIPARWPV